MNAEPAIVAIPPEEVARYWQEFVPALRNSSKGCAPEAMAQIEVAIKELAQRGERTLWVVTGADVAANTAISEADSFGTLGRTCVVWPMFGPNGDRSRLVELMSQIEAGARSLGCASVELHYSWEAETDQFGYRKTLEVFSKDIRGGLN